MARNKITKYFWFYGATADTLRGIGANHIHPTKFWMNRQLCKSEIRDREFIFQSEEGFQLFCKLVTGYEPVEYSERQYKRLVRGENIDAYPALNLYNTIQWPGNPDLGFLG